jgi:uncharacterized protein (TIGR00730 family)
MSMTPSESTPPNNAVPPTQLRSGKGLDHDAAQRAALLAELRMTVDKLERDEASRGDLKILARALKELRYAFKVFTPYRHHRKITVFGSARTPPDHPDYQLAVEFGRRMAHAGWMVVTGAGGGIMEGAHVGAGQAMSMGVNILLPFEQEANYVINKDQKLVTFRYFFTRKLMFVKEVHAVALFPGGFGTLDELFEVLTLVQTGKRDILPIVCVDQPGGSYWSGLSAFLERELYDRRLVSPHDRALFKITDNLDEAVAEVKQFYSVYHSLRYVRDKLVLRLNSPPSDALLERLNDEFASILTAGRIERSDLHPHEQDEEHTHHLSRISLSFNRRDAGTLRMLIDALNASAEDAE